MIAQELPKRVLQDADKPAASRTGFCALRHDPNVQIAGGKPARLEVTRGFALKYPVLVSLAVIIEGSDQRTPQSAAVHISGTPLPGETRNPALTRAR